MAYSFSWRHHQRRPLLYPFQQPEVTNTTDGYGTTAPSGNDPCTTGSLELLRRRPDSESGSRDTVVLQTSNPVSSSPSSYLQKSQSNGTLSKKRVEAHRIRRDIELEYISFDAMTREERVPNMHLHLRKMRERIEDWEQGETGTSRARWTKEANPTVVSSIENATPRHWQDRYQWRERKPAKNNCPRQESFEGLKPSDSSTDLDEDRAPRIETTTTQLYCLCQQPEHGLMIACDDADCPYEWFHLNCLGMKRAPDPEGQWYCSHCQRVRQRQRAGNELPDLGETEVRLSVELAA